MCDHILMHEQNKNFRGICRNPATSKMKSFVPIVNGFNPLTIVKKNSILDAYEVLV